MRFATIKQANASCVISKFFLYISGAISRSIFPAILLPQGIIPAVLHRNLLAFFQRILETASACATA